MGVTSTGGAGGKGAKYKALGAVVAWFTSTVVLISCNKVLMLQGGFRLPIFLTFLHMIVSYAWCEFSAEMVRIAGERTIRDRRAIHRFEFA